MALAIIAIGIEVGMNGKTGYAVFFFPQALEALGDAIKPFLQDGAAGLYVACDEIDTGGALIEMTMHAKGNDKITQLELMVPSAMVRMVVSTHSDELFGFSPHPFDRGDSRLPVLGPTAHPGENGNHTGEQPPAIANAEAVNPASGSDPATTGSS